DAGGVWSGGPHHQPGSRHAPRPRPRARPRVRRGRPHVLAEVAPTAVSPSFSLPSFSMDVCYLDNHLLVVNKPAGMLSQADRTGDTDLITHAKAFLKERFDKPGNVFVGLVHRLDRPASGLMVLARTSKAAARLTEQFRQRTPDKRYLALVEGRHDGAGHCVDSLV